MTPEGGGSAGLRRAATLAEVDQLRGAFGQEAVARWLANGVAHRLDDAYDLLFQLVADPVRGTTDAYAAWAPPALLEDRSAVRALSTASQATGADRLVVRLEAYSAEHCWLSRHLAMQFMTLDGVARSELARARPPRGYAVRPATAADRDFVAGLLVEALIAGYETAGASAVDPNAGLDVVRSGAWVRLGDPLRTGSAVLVADGQLVGHATWNLGEADELTGAPYLELVDVFVLEGHRGKGASAALSAAAAAVALERGEPLIGNVVAQADGGHQAITAALERAGWTRAHGHAVLPLR